MPLDSPKVRVRVVLKAGSSKHEVRSPDPLPRDEAEGIVAAIRKARQEKSEVELPWLAASGSDVAAAYIEIDPTDDQRTPDELLAELERLGVVVKPAEAE